MKMTGSKMGVLRFLRRMASIGSYPRYITDLYLRWGYPVWLRHTGISAGTGIIWHGMPILSQHSGSTLCIGDNCRICSRAADTALGVNHAVILRTLAPEAELRIGNGVRMSGTSICSRKSVVIGNHCVFGANVTIVDTDFHSLDAPTRRSPQDALAARFAPVTIGNNVFIGAGSYILKGVTLGEGTVVGAGSIVTRSFPPHSIVAGNPARQVASHRHTTD